MTITDIAPMLLVACFGLLALALWQLARIQMEAIGYLRGISLAEAKEIYFRDYTDGDGANFHWSEMRAYCRGTGRSGRLRFWAATALISVAGGFGSVFLDQALR